MPFVVVVLWLILGAFQVGAYLAGIKLWLGLGTLAGLLSFFVTAALPFGAVVDAAIAFHGATAVWRWTGWHAALLCFPFALLGLVIHGLGTVLRWIDRGAEAGDEPTP